ncbi:MAG: basic amino acid ABC transporter substrate-binding protein [Fusobacteriaceae bacterium]
MKKILNLIKLLLVCVVASISVYGKTLYVGTNAEFEPFEYLENGKIVGFDIELIEEIAKILKIDIKMENMAFDGLLPALQMKKVDIVIAGMTASEVRKQFVGFSEPYFTAKQVLLVKEGSSIKSLDDLKNKKVGAVLGYTGDLMVSKINEITVERVSSTAAAIMGLKNEKSEAVILDFAPAQNFVKKNKGLKIVTLDTQDEEYAIATRKDDTELLANINSALKELKENGVFDKLLFKYF